MDHADYKWTVTAQKSHCIHQITTMLATSKNVLFLGHNHLLATGTVDPTLWLLPEQLFCAVSTLSYTTVKNVMSAIILSFLTGFLSILQWWVPGGTKLICLWQKYMHVHDVSIHCAKKSTIYYLTTLYCQSGKLQWNCDQTFDVSEH